MRNLKTFLLFGLLFSMCTLFGQNNSGNNVRFVEVTGYAEQEVIPDEIYLSLTLRENTGKTKVTLKEQEEKLIVLLKSMGYNLDNIQMKDADSYYNRIPWRSGSIILKNTYTIKLTTAEEVKTFIEGLNDFNDYTIYLLQTKYSQTDQLKETLRNKAILDGKAKAEKMTAVLGDSIGSVIIVSETPYPSYEGTTKYDLNRTPSRSIGVYNSDIERVIEIEPKLISIQVYLRFEIK